MLRYLRRRLRRRPSRLFHLFQIEPTLQCNLQCVMCPWTSLDSERGHMAWSTYLRIAACFHLATDIDLTGGGEPLTQPRLLDMVRLAKKAGCTVGFSTNATLLSSDLSAALVDEELDWIVYSVDGATAGTYESIRRGASFDHVLANIEAMRQARAERGRHVPKTMLFFVMMKANIHELPACLDLAQALGIDHVVAKNLDVILKEEDDRQRLFGYGDDPPPAKIQALLAEARRRAEHYGLPLRIYAMQPQEAVVCEQDPLHNVFFDWQGSVSPCITLAYAERHLFQGIWHTTPRLRFGSIDQQDLLTIWEKPAYREFRAMYEARWRAHSAATMDLFGAAPSSGEATPPRLPPAPESCQVCHYLYQM
jgi:MoaA/NifB/PqqE/SkfB family radical SAM enzyme